MSLFASKFYFSRYSCNGCHHDRKHSNEIESIEDCIKNNESECTGKGSSNRSDRPEIVCLMNRLKCRFRFLRISYILLCILYWSAYNFTRLQAIMRDELFENFIPFRSENHTSMVRISHLQEQFMKLYSTIYVVLMIAIDTREKKLLRKL